MSKKAYLLFKHTNNNNNNNENNIFYYCIQTETDFTFSDSLYREKKTLFYYINTNEIPGELWRKLDIFTCENNMLSSRVKISPLLWLHNKSRHSDQKTIKVKWFCISLVFI